MKVNVKSLINLVDKFSKLIEEYEVILLNMNNQYKNISMFWQGTDANFFLDELDREKNKINNTYLELVSIKDLYLRIINKYEKIGNKIKVNLDDEKLVINNINNTLNKVNFLINLYNEIDLINLGLEGQLIIKEKNSLLNMRKKLLNYKTDVINLFLEVNEIEKLISLKISKIDIQVVKENLFEFKEIV